MDHEFDIQLNNKTEYFRESSTCSIELSSHLHNHLVSKTILSKTLKKLRKHSCLLWQKIYFQVDK